MDKLRCPNCSITAPANEFEKVITYESDIKSDRQDLKLKVYAESIGWNYRYDVREKLCIWNQTTYPLYFVNGNSYIVEVDYDGRLVWCYYERIDSNNIHGDSAWVNQDYNKSLKVLLDKYNPLRTK